VTADSVPAAERPTHVRYVVLLVLCLATVINYVQRNCIGPAETTVRADLGLTKLDTGDVISVFFVVYALMQIPSGWLAQQWGPRLALTVFAVGWSLSLGLSALATGFRGLFSARIAMGALQAGIFPCCTLAIAAWLPPTRRAFASAMLNSFMLIGGAAGAQLSGVLLGPLGWRGLFAAYALPGVAWAAFFYVWFRDRPENHPAVNDAELNLIGFKPPPRLPAEALQRTTSIFEARKKGENLAANVGAVVAKADDPAGEESPPSSGANPSSTPPVRIRASFVVVFLSLTMWLVGIQQAFRAGANRFYDNWLPTYLQEARGCTKVTAANLSSWPQYAGVIGGLVGGLLSDWVLQRTGSRRAGRQGVAVGSLLLGSLFFALAYFTPDVTAAVLLLSAGAFLTIFAAPCAYALTMDLGGRNLGIVFSTMNMAGNLGSTAFTWAVPRLNEWGGWDATLFVFAGAHIAAALCWLPLNPNGVIGEPRHSNGESP
jgi:MFS family permease